MEGWQSLADCTGLENQQGVKPFGGSNPSPSAPRTSIIEKRAPYWGFFLYKILRESHESEHTNNTQITHIYPTRFYNSDRISSSSDLRLSV